MRRLKAEKPFHALINVNGSVEDVGDGDPIPQDDQSVIWFDSIRERETDERISTWRANRVKERRRANEVEAPKSSQEYAGKSENAVRWLMNNPPQNDETSLAHTHGDYTEEGYIWLALEVEYVGKTPRQAAQEIVDAVKRNQDAEMGSWEKAKQRIITREQLKND